MRLVTAIVKPFKLDDVKDALTQLGLPGITVTDPSATRKPPEPGPNPGAHAASGE